MRVQRNRTQGGMGQRARRGQKPESDRRRRVTGAARIYDKLRDEILSLTLRPGTPLDEVGLGRRFKLSRSPVREALIRLAGEQLVVILPNRSTVVAPFDFEGMPRHLDALELMQRTTHRLAAMLRTDADLEVIRAAEERFRQANEHGDVPAMIEANRDFHMAIAEAGRNPYFASLYGRLLDEGRRLLHMHFALEVGPHELRHKPVVAEHAAITRAIAERDADQAEGLALEHASQFRERFIRHIDQNYVRTIRLRDPGLHPAAAKPREILHA